MVSVASILIAVIAALTWALIVPRIRIDDPEAPQLDALVTAPSIAVVALVAALLGQGLWLVQVELWWLWMPYLALGLPLVAVDALTTWLPRRLHLIVAGAMAAGWIGLLLQDWRAALAGLAGAAAGYVCFWFAWRLTGGLGFGDVRLAALIGAIAGVSGPTFWVLSFVCGTVIGAVHGIAHAVWAARHPGRPTHFAYGPALWLGPLIAALISAA